MILSATMMLRHLGLDSHADRISKATYDVLAEGQATTQDIGGSATTTEFTDAILKNKFPKFTMHRTYKNTLELDIQLKRSQFKTPIEVVKKNFKNLQKLVEKHNNQLSKSLKTLESKKTKDSQLQALRKIIQQQETFHKKLAFRVKQHNEFISRLQCRFEKLKQLKLMNEAIASVDSKDEMPPRLISQINKFYKEEINLVIIDYLLKTSQKNISTKALDKNPGAQLAKELNVEKLVDYDVILQGLTIYNEIKLNKNLKILIDWCSENRKSLKLIKEHSKLNVNLEFETHFQEFIEKIKANELYDALEIANKHLISYMNDSDEGDNTTSDANGNGTGTEASSESDDYSFNKITSGAALLWWNAFKENAILRQNENQALLCSPMGFYDSKTREMDKVKANVKPYEDLLNDMKWTKLADFFLYNFNSLYGIDQELPILTLLNIGGSALKTRSCIHRGQESNQNGKVDGASSVSASAGVIGHNEVIASTISSNVASSTTQYKNSSSFQNDGDVNFDEVLKQSNNNSIFSNECPICSIDLSELTSNLPFSHQVKSNIYDDPVLLPNGNIYEYDKLLKLSETLGKSNHHHHGHGSGSGSADSAGDGDGQSSPDSTGSSSSEVNIFDRPAGSDAVDFESMEPNLLDEYKIRDPLTEEEFERKELVLVFPP
ncbi:unnamed protein product [Ambrosiozyma monospora]|uniref:Unnamed protein product n=1 Tax=Ambrosiozyma monospora TaxID=43982 RepID=A0ACB5SR83_AMBMO|nr:unnamed protein product [Ambrosiozyma monospora]